PLYNNVKYQWQEKKSTANTWTNVGNDAPQFTISNVTMGMSGNLYRVVVTPTDPFETCKISISRKVSLTVGTTNIWRGATDTNWNNASNWSCGSIPDLTTEILIPDGLPNYP
ncbi:hypothetical protein ACNKXS_15180, partial [Christiangramia marina]